MNRGMVAKILCVAEKPSIAKAVANHLGGNVTCRSVPGLPWLKNYEFDFNFSPPWGKCSVIVTSVAGHLKSQDFDDNHRSWNSCDPVRLFDAPIVKYVGKDKTVIAKNIETQAKFSKALFIWTDCDREGEYIGTEIREVALKANSRLEVKRARFSNIERAHIIQAANHPIELDEKQANAVAARIELDLRIGASFTRMQTISLKPIVAHVQAEKAIISYGSCQFPTLGFVVDRYFKVKNFVPEPFWNIRVMHERDDIQVRFNWKRVHLFDRMLVTIIFERCINAKLAKITGLERKPTSKWKPLPLTTVELQKVGSRFLRMDSQRTMQIAESLYQKGFISYPRTETDQFDREMNLRSIVGRQTADSTWGSYAQGLLDGNFCQPRSGRNNDKAHPPIHPVNYIARNQLDAEEGRVYEFVVRRFLACCSEDAKGESTNVELTYGGEIFNARGLIVLERNYLEVYPYDKWESSQELPKFTLGEEFEPTEAMMNEGKTSPPRYLTEPELIALMDANGIGTDATMAEHIAKIKERDYVMARPRSGGIDDEAPAEEPATRGRGGARGRGRGRGGARGGVGNGNTGGTSMQEFIPTTLGVALIEGYDNIGLDTSLSKPFLRKEMELQLKAICAGTTSRSTVVQSNLDSYREVFLKTTRQIDTLKAAVRKYVTNPSG